jgi:hypothetical protein
MPNIPEWREKSRNRSFLAKEIDVIDAQRSELLVGTFESHQKTAK